MERIKKSGGKVKTNVEGGSGPMRVYKLNDGNPGLAVARSLGIAMDMNVESVKSHRCHIEY